MKQEANSISPRYKGRLMVKGFRQRNGVDFNDILSLAMKMSSTKIMLSLTATLDLEVEQIDVKITFLQGALEEEIYIKKLYDFLVEGKEDYMFRLKKSLHGLKQSPKQWYKKFKSFIC